jgi:cell division protein YceG involved in septum cleavage
LEGRGYIILEESEYNALQGKATVPNKTKLQEREKVEVKEPNKNTEEDVQDEPDANPIINYQLEISSGMTSNEIATILAQNQIVQDEAAFAHLLIKHNYHTAIQLGSFPVTNQMSFEQIANMITKN